VLGGKLKNLANVSVGRRVHSLRGAWVMNIPKEHEDGGWRGGWCGLYRGGESICRAANLFQHCPRIGSSVGTKPLL